jgi:hypothetical protein
VTAALGCGRGLTKSIAAEVALVRGRQRYHIVVVEAAEILEGELCFRINGWAHPAVAGAVGKHIGKEMLAELEALDSRLENPLVALAGFEDIPDWSHIDGEGVEEVGDVRVGFLAIDGATHVFVTGVSAPRITLGVIVVNYALGVGPGSALRSRHDLAEPHARKAKGELELCAPVLVRNRRAIVRMTFGVVAPVGAVLVEGAVHVRAQIIEAVVYAKALRKPRHGHDEHEIVVVVRSGWIECVSRGDRVGEIVLAPSLQRVRGCPALILACRSISTSRLDGQLVIVEIMIGGEITEMAVVQAKVFDTIRGPIDCREVSVDGLFEQFVVGMQSPNQAVRGPQSAAVLRAPNGGAFDEVEETAAKVGGRHVVAKGLGPAIDTHDREMLAEEVFVDFGDAFTEANVLGGTPGQCSDWLQDQAGNGAGYEACLKSVAIPHGGWLVHRMGQG